MVGWTRASGPGLGIRHVLLVASTVVALVSGALVVPAASASADPVPRPSVAIAEPPRPTGPVVQEQTLTPQQLAEQVKAADELRAELMKSSAEVAAATARLESISAEANTLLARLSTARTAQAEAESDAAAQSARLRDLGRQVEGALDALGQLASDSYMRGGGPLGDLTAILEALTAPSVSRNTDSLATVRYLVEGRARLFERLQALRSEQVKTAARAETARVRAAAAAKSAAQAKSRLDGVIAEQRIALDGFRAAQGVQVGRAASLRGSLLRSENPLAQAADKRLAEALQGQDYKLLTVDGSSCGKDSATYPNGHFPASALCPLYAAPEESLSHDAAMAFNAMTYAYQQETGSALCVTDGYRPYAEQVAVKLASPKLAATPGRSQHGLGLAVDLCGGVQNFASPAHLWMKQNAPLYGWFHPAWAEPTGVMPEPWHWEFAS